jgi:hypothetical protein
MQIYFLKRFKFQNFTGAEVKRLELKISRRYNDFLKRRLITFRLVVAGLLVLLFFARRAKTLQAEKNQCQLKSLRLESGCTYTDATVIRRFATLPAQTLI